MCYNGFTIKISLFKSKRFKEGRCNTKILGGLAWAKGSNVYTGWIGLGKGFKCFLLGSEIDPGQVFPYKWGLKALLAIQVAQEILAVACLRPKREEKPK